MLIYADVGLSPAILYWGDQLLDEPSAEALDDLRRRDYGDGSASVEVPITLMCESGTGFTGPPGLEVHRDGQSWALTLQVTAVSHDETSISIDCLDDQYGISTQHVINLDRVSDVARLTTSIRNEGNGKLALNALSAATLPFDSMLNEIIHFSGRWAGEFQADRAPLRQGGFISENRRGRTSHDRFPGVVLCEQSATERLGHCMGIHLGWSGNHTIRVETLADGRRMLQAGELLLPGEVHLAPNETYSTPSLYIAYSSAGLNRLSNQFHRYYHDHFVSDRVRSKPRPVHYNSWEGIYFDHSPATIMKLANEAAKIGVERFVLDDGWFLGRRNDEAGLGDWTVDPSIYPEGLKPVVDHVQSLGMEFGLWVEPEMVNIDSDLYREHSDWILGGPPDAQVPFRNQFVLDMARKEVADNIFKQLDDLLTEYDIAYLKWDMNRDLNRADSADGFPSAHRQTRAVYSLIDRLRAKHPSVEIESCCSGGARIDYGILERTDRVWTSDSIDALDRQIIQRGASVFFPLSILGSHVGQSVCRITHRTLPVTLQAATALFGHMGVESDLLKLSDAERAEIAEAIALHKKHRKLIHQGEFVRIDGPPNQNIIGVVDADKSNALYSVVQTMSNRDNLPGVLRFPELDPIKNYVLRIVWPTAQSSPHACTTGAVGWDDDAHVSGDVLMKIGLQLPLLHPEMCLIYELRANE